MTPQEYCQNKAAKSGSSFYYSFLSLPNQKREAIIAVYAFCREVDDIVDAPGDLQVKSVKLNWWHQEIHNLYKAKPQHPITLALKPVINHFSIPEEYFSEIIDGMQMDLTQNRYASFKELSLYCYRVASVVGLISAEIFGYQDRQTLKYANDLGMAFQLTNIIRDVYDDYRNDRVYIPQDELEKFGVTENDIKSQNHNEAFNELMRYQAERANSYYDKAFAQLPDSDRFTQRAGIIMSSIYHALLTEIIKDNYQVLIHRVRLSSFRKIWIVWCAKRNENKRHKIYLKQHARQ